MTWLTALAGLYGHAPADAREWALRDLQLLELAHELRLRQSPFWEV